MCIFFFLILSLNIGKKITQFIIKKKCIYKCYFYLSKFWKLVLLVVPKKFFNKLIHLSYTLKLKLKCSSNICFGLMALNFSQMKYPLYSKFSLFIFLLSYSVSIFFVFIIEKFKFNLRHKIFIWFCFLYLLYMYVYYTMRRLYVQGMMPLWWHELWNEFPNNIVVFFSFCKSTAPFWWYNGVKLIKMYKYNKNRNIKKRQNKAVSLHCTKQMKY